MVKTETYTTGNEILIKPETARRVGCLVKKPLLADNGVYIVKAGSPLYTEEAIDAAATFDRSKALVDTKGTGTAVGVLYQDVVFVDEKAESANGVLVINGVVDYLKLDATIQTKVDTAASELTHIQFVKGRAD